MLGRLLVNFRYVVGGIGLFFALAQVNTNMTTAVSIAALWAVGAVAILSFVNHVILHKQDAKAVGFGKGDVGFQFEVGFANLAIGVVAVLSFLAQWGVLANVALILVYAFYLLQTGILHTLNTFKGKRLDTMQLVRGGIVTFVFSGALFFIAFRAMTSGLF